MNGLQEIIAQRISTGLQRKSVTTCSRWSEIYRVIGGGAFAGPWRFKYHPWLREMHDCDEDMIVGKKAAQMGYTECALNKTFYQIDMHRNNCMYILPASTPDASDFSTSRFDSALEASPHLANLFSDVKNIHHKRAGSANLFVRGSRSRSQLKSVPASFIAGDEVDEFVQEHIPMIFERMSGQLISQIFFISTPTIQNYGISKLYDDSTQDHFMFRCPCCSRLTELTFPECLHIEGEDYTTKEIRKSHLLCKECKGVLDHKSKHTWLKDGIWVPGHSDRTNRGFHINQLYSSTVEPYKLATSYLKGLRDPAEAQEFNNSKLGTVYEEDGARVTTAMLEKCIGGHKKVHGHAGGIVTMGVDVGKVLHVEIDQWFPNRYPSSDPNLAAHCKLLNQFTIKDFEELDHFMRAYGVLFAVIDAQPERRKSLEFCERFHGIAKACWYPRGASGKILHMPDSGDQFIKADRTSWLDLALGRFKNSSITLPIDTNNEYKDQIMAPVRVYKKTSETESIGEYKCGSAADHFAHARNYSEIAYRALTGVGVSTNITGVM